MTRPFTDLACELRDGVPVCHVPEDVPECATDKKGWWTCSHLMDGGKDMLCILAVRRMAAVFEAARERAEQNDEIVRGAMLAANANMED
jgi:hypothetical protein